MDRVGPLPLWQQVQQDLRSRLDGGEFAAGFPGEHALVTEYGVSRQTVREALRALRAEGLVTAARGRSPRLADPARFTQPLGALASLFAAVEAGGLEQRSIVRRLELTADGVIAPRLGLEESSPLVHLERLRLAGGEPLALDRVWLPASIAAPLLEADFSHTSLYAELGARCGARVEGGQEQVRAAIPTTAERRLLELGPGVALLVIHRSSSWSGRPLEWRQTLVRGDRYAMCAAFPATSGRPGLCGPPAGTPLAEAPAGGTGAQSRSWAVLGAG